MRWSLRLSCFSLPIRPPYVLVALLHWFMMGPILAISVLSSEFDFRLEFFLLLVKNINQLSKQNRGGAVSMPRAFSFASGMILTRSV